MDKHEKDSVKYRGAEAGSELIGIKPLNIGATMPAAVLVTASFQIILVPTLILVPTVTLDPARYVSTASATTSAVLALLNIVACVGIKVSSSQG